MSKPGDHDADERGPRHGAASLRITASPVADLAGYARVPSSFQVRQVLDCVEVEGGLGGLSLARRRVATPWIKDYDQLEPPTAWPARFDLTHWGMLRATQDGAAVGGAVVAWNDASCTMLGGRNDLAVLWDLRVAPMQRGRGIGRRLLEAAAAWAREGGCRWLLAETQNVNVPACRLYRSCGFALDAIRRHAYPDLPDEVQLLWRRQLESSSLEGG